MSEKDVPPRDGSIGDESWVCPRCNLTVLGSCKPVRLLRGEVVNRYRCTHCKARYDTIGSEADPFLRWREANKTLMGRCEMRLVARRIRRAHQKELRRYRKQFIRDLRDFDFLSEIARQEGSWRTS